MISYLPCVNSFFDRRQLKNDQSAGSDTLRASKARIYRGGNQNGRHPPKIYGEIRFT